MKRYRTSLCCRSGMSYRRGLEWGTKKQSLQGMVANASKMTVVGFLLAMDRTCCGLRTSLDIAPQPRFQLVKAERPCCVQPRNKGVGLSGFRR